MTIKPKFLFAAAALAAAAPSFAAVTLFSDRPTFIAATAATTVEDFTEEFHAPIASGILNSSTAEAGLVAGDILPGVTYSTPVGSGFFFNIDVAAGFGNPASDFQGGFLDSLAFSDSEARALTITFDSLQGAFGFDTSFLMGSFSLSIFDDVGSIYTGAFAQPASDQLYFFGFANSEASIRRVVIQGNREAATNYALDNFTFNGNPVSGAIPEPATWAMLIIGFGLVGAAARRRRPQAAPRTV